MISYVDPEVLTRFNSTRMESTAFIIPPPINAGITGVKVVEITLMIRLITFPFSFSSFLSAFERLPSPNSSLIARKVVWTSFPITIWNCPPLSTTLMTPGVVSIFLTATLLLS